MFQFIQLYFLSSFCYNYGHVSSEIKIIIIIIIIANAVLQTPKSVVYGTTIHNT